MRGGRKWRNEREKQKKSREKKKKKKERRKLVARTEADWTDYNEGRGRDPNEWKKIRTAATNSEDGTSLGGKKTVTEQKNRKLHVNGHGKKIGMPGKKNEQKKLEERNGPHRKGR